MKVCYYNHTGKVSGAEKVLFTLIANLGPGFETSLVSPPTEPIRQFCEKRRILQVPVDELSARFTMNPFLLVKYASSCLKGILQVRRVVKEIAPDVLHANSTRAGMIACLATLGSKTPVIWHVHDRLKKHPITSMIRLLLGSSSRNSVIAVSHATAEAVRGDSRSYVARRVPIAVIHNGVDSQAYAPQPFAVESFLEKEGLKDVPFRMAMVGQITPRKGQLETIETFAQFARSDCPRAQLLIIGTAVFNNDHLYMERLKIAVARLGMEHNVRFMGHRGDIPVILQSSHVLISNSSSEPFGLVLLEGCASAMPVLAAAVDGVPELILDGVTGTLFPHGDSDAMLRAIKRLHGDPEHARSLGMAARDRTQLHFTQEGFLQQVRQLYAGMVPALPAKDRGGFAPQAAGWGVHDA